MTKPKTKIIGEQIKQTIKQAIKQTIKQTVKQTIKQAIKQIIKQANETSKSRTIDPRIEHTNSRNRELAYPCVKRTLDHLRPISDVKVQKHRAVVEQGYHEVTSSIPIPSIPFLKSRSQKPDRLDKNRHGDAFNRATGWSVPYREAREINVPEIPNTTNIMKRMTWSRRQLYNLQRRLKEDFSQIEAKVFPYDSVVISKQGAKNFVFVVTSKQGAKNFVFGNVFSLERRIFKSIIMPKAKKKPRNYGIFSWYDKPKVSERLILITPLDYPVCSFWGKLLRNV
ncbi:hypothetical protein M0802_015250 [Mischocyttarus mexicanus]|nr:hypothetical protein M0802_015250 [Mischocyttarus mexicanus]